MEIYKYSNTGIRSLENLKNGELYFNSPSNFSDTNDSNLKITEEEFDIFCKKSIEYFESISNEKFQKLTPPKGFYEWLEEQKLPKNFLVRFNEFKKAFVGITCFSERSDIPEMWDGYAIRNTGFCNCFETKFDPNFFNGLTKVNYVKDLPIVDLSSEKFEKGLVEFYTTKHVIDYHFEEEQRLIKTNQGLFKYDKECVQEIILGRKMNSVDKNKIINIVREFYGERVFVTQS
jgi:hypothetical protein